MVNPGVGRNTVRALTRVVQARVRDPGPVSESPSKRTSQTTVTGIFPTTTETREDSRPSRGMSTGVRVSPTQSPRASVVTVVDRHTPPDSTPREARYDVVTSTSSAAEAPGTTEDPRTHLD